MNLTNALLTLILRLFVCSYMVVGVLTAIVGFAFIHNNWIMAIIDFFFWPFLWYKDSTYHGLVKMFVEGIYRYIV